MLCGRDEEPRPNVTAYYKIIYDLCMLQGYERMMSIIKTSIKRTKEDHWKCVIMVCAQAIKNKLKWK